MRNLPPFANGWSGASSDTDLPASTFTDASNVSYPSARTRTL